MIRNIRFILFALCVSLAVASHAEPQISEPAPLLDTELVGGGALKAKELEGKVVLVVFWATWCPACARELPELQSFYSAYREKGFEILALSLDKKAADVADYWNKKGYTFPVAMRAGSVREAWGTIRFTPQLVLIDRKGIVRMKYVGAMKYEQLEAEVRPLL